LLDWATLPLWATLLKRIITALVLIGFGLHAYVQYKRHGKDMAAPERWAMVIFSVIFLFGTVVNLTALVIAYERQQKQGPFEFGLFSLIIAIIYLVFLYRSHRRHTIY
jgi:hypothetical protein